MNKKVKKIFQSNEPYIFLIIILLGIVVQIRSGQFFTANNIVDLLSAMIVPGPVSYTHLTLPTNSLV